MKKKYLHILFHHIFSAFDSDLTDEQKEEFYNRFPGLRWMSGSEDEMDSHINAIPVPALEMWIEEIIKHLVKYDKWHQKRMKGCLWL